MGVGGIIRSHRAPVDDDDVQEAASALHPVVQAFYDRQAAEARVAAAENAERLWGTAVHESAHCVTAIALGRPYYSLEINPGGGGGCFHQHPPSAEPTTPPPSFRGHPPHDMWVVHSTTIKFAGMFGEMRALAPDFATGCGSDLRRIHRVLDDICDGNRALKKYLLWRGRDLAGDTVEKHWPIIETLARALQSRRKLIRDEIVEVVRRAPGGYELLGEQPPALVRHDDHAQDVEHDVLVRDDGGTIGVVQRTANGYLGIMCATRQQVLAPTLAGARKAIRRIRCDPAGTTCFRRFDARSLPRYVTGMHRPLTGAERQARFRAKQRARMGELANEVAACAA
jgi:hypothetical protein